MTDLEKRQKNNMIFYYTTGFLNALMVLMLGIEHCHILMAINIAVAICFFYLGYSSRDEKTLERNYIIYTIAITIYLASHYIMLGPSFGFQYISIGAIPLIFYVSYYLKKDIVITTWIAIGSFVLFAIISVSCSFMSYPIYQIHNITNRIIISMNIVMAFYLAISSMRDFIDETSKEQGILKTQNDNLETSANVDVLTGLRNRRTIKQYVDAAFKAALGQGEDFSLLMCDIDNFKSVNDTYGHDYGDQVLKNVANILCREVRDEDIVFRWGGEEILILVYARKYTAKRVAERCREAIEKSNVVYKDQIINVTITIGGASYYQGATYEDLVNRADENLYIGKNNGKNQVVI